MSKPKTYVALLLDRSGSMWRTREQAVSSYNEYVQDMIARSKDQEIKISLVTFGGDIQEHLWIEDVSNLQEANSEDFVPNGGTPMRDAIGYTIQKLKDTTDPNEDAAYLVVVISDGEDTSSSQYAKPLLKEMIEGCQGSGKWTFTYLGCSESYLKELAHETGVPVANMAAWSNADLNKAKRGLDYVGARYGAYFNARAKGVRSTFNMMSDVDGLCRNVSDDDPELAVAASAEIKAAPVQEQSAQNVWTPPKVTYATEVKQNGNSVFGSGKRITLKS